MSSRSPPLYYAAIRPPTQPTRFSFTCCNPATALILSDHTSRLDPIRPIASAQSDWMLLLHLKDPERQEPITARSECHGRSIPKCRQRGDNVHRRPVGRYRRCGANRFECARFKDLAVHRVDGRFGERERDPLAALHGIRQWCLWERVCVWRAGGRMVSQKKNATSGRRGNKKKARTRAKKMTEAKENAWERRRRTGGEETKRKQGHARMRWPTPTRTHGNDLERYLETRPNLLFEHAVCVMKRGCYTSCGLCDEDGPLQSHRGHLPRAVASCCASWWLLALPPWPLPRPEPLLRLLLLQRQQHCPLPLAVRVNAGRGFACRAVP